MKRFEVVKTMSDNNVAVKDMTDMTTHQMLDYGSALDVCILLNELNDENEQLKRKNKFLKNQYERKDRQLHRTKKDIEKYTDYFMNELNWDCERIIKEVFK